MTVLCDYTVIRESEIIIGNNSDRNDPDIVVATDGPFRGPRFSKKFNTDGRENAQALLMINVRGLTDNSAVVMVNNKIVKSLTPCPSGQFRPNVLAAYSAAIELAEPHGRQQQARNNESSGRRRWQRPVR